MAALRRQVDGGASWRDAAGAVAAELGASRRRPTTAPWPCVDRMRIPPAGRRSGRSVPSPATSPPSSATIPSSRAKPSRTGCPPVTVGRVGWTRSVRYVGAPFYVTTPIYYVNDAPHVGHAYTTVNADALARWHRLAGDEVFFLTGTDEHGDKIGRGGGGERREPAGVDGPTSERFVEAWAALDISNDDFIRTTEPRHHASGAAVPADDLRQRLHRLGRLQGPVLRELRGLLQKESSSSRASVPIHGRPSIEMEEENYFFKLSAFEDRLLEWYEANPDAVRPTTKRNEALGFIKGGLRGHLDHAHVALAGGCRFPGTTRHVFYVWYDALINYLTAIGYGERRGRVRDVVAGRRTTSSARTSSASTACGGRRCAWPPASTRRRTCWCTGGSSWAARSCRRSMAAEGDRFA